MSVVKRGEGGVRTLNSLYGPGTGPVMGSEDLPSCRRFRAGTMEAASCGGAPERPRGRSDGYQMQRTDGKAGGEGGCLVVGVGFQNVRQVFF